MKLKDLAISGSMLIIAGCSSTNSPQGLENILNNGSNSQEPTYITTTHKEPEETSDNNTYDKLKHPSLSFKKPTEHYVADDIEKKKLSDIQIGVDTITRNVYIFNGEISYDSMIFRAPTILGNSGHNLEGTFYVSSFSGPGTVWIPEEEPHKRYHGVFGDMWMPMQNINVAVNQFSGGWAPRGYNLYAIHGTNKNDLFESQEKFIDANSRGCSRLYKDAISDFKDILKLSSPDIEDISESARFKNPDGNVYALGRVIEVTFGENLVRPYY